jgi:hypothetical protein
MLRDGDVGVIVRNAHAALGRRLEGDGTVGPLRTVLLKGHWAWVDGKAEWALPKVRFYREAADL